MMFEYPVPVKIDIVVIKPDEAVVKPDVVWIKPEYVVVKEDVAWINHDL